MATPAGEQRVSTTLKQIGELIQSHTGEHRGASNKEQREQCRNMLESAKTALLQLSKHHLSAEQTLPAMDLVCILLGGRQCEESFEVFHSLAIQELAVPYLAKSLAVLSCMGVERNLEKEPFFQSAVQLCTVLANSDLAFIHRLLLDIRCVLQNTQMLREKFGFQPLKTLVDRLPEAITVPETDPNLHTASNGIAKLVSNLIICFSRVPLAKTLPSWQSLYATLELTLSEVPHALDFGATLSLLNAAAFMATDEDTAFVLLPAIFNHLLVLSPTKWPDLANLDFLLLRVLNACLISPRIRDMVLHPILELLISIGSAACYSTIRCTLLRFIADQCSNWEVVDLIYILDVVMDESSPSSSLDIQIEVGLLISEVLTRTPTLRDAIISELNPAIIPRTDAKRARTDSLTCCLSSEKFASIEKTIVASLNQGEGVLGIVSLCNHVDSGHRLQAIRDVLVTKGKSVYANMDVLLKRRFADAVFRTFLIQVVASDSAAISTNDEMEYLLKGLGSGIRAMPTDIDYEQLCKTVLQNNNSASINLQILIKYPEIGSRLLKYVVARINVLPLFDQGETRELLMGIRLLMEWAPATDAWSVFVRLLPSLCDALTSAKTPSAIRVEIVNLVANTLESLSYVEVNSVVVPSLISSLVSDPDPTVRSTTANVIGCLIKRKPDGSRCAGFAALESYYKNGIDYDNLHNFLHEIKTRLSNLPPGSLISRVLIVAIGCIACVPKLNAVSQGRDREGIQVIPWALLELSRQIIKVHQFAPQEPSAQINCHITVEQIHLISKAQGLDNGEGHAWSVRDLFTRVQESLFPDLFRELLDCMDVRSSAESIDMRVLSFFHHKVFQGDPDYTIVSFVKDALPVILGPYVEQWNESLLGKLASIFDHNPTKVGFKIRNLLLSQGKWWIGTLVALRAEFENSTNASRRASIQQMLREIARLERDDKWWQHYKLGTKVVLGKLILQLVEQDTDVPNPKAYQALSILARSIHPPGQELNNSPLQVSKAVQRLLHTEFMYLMTLLSESLQESVDSGNAKRKRHIILCIWQLLELLKSDTVTGDAFCPKVFPALSQALQDRDTQGAACKALEALAFQLSDKAFDANITAFIVALLPCLSGDVRALTFSSSNSQTHSPRANGGPEMRAVNLMTAFVKRKGVDPVVLAEVSVLLPSHSALEQLREMLNGVLASKINDKDYGARIEMLSSILERTDSDDIRLTALVELRKILSLHSGDMHNQVLLGRITHAAVVTRALLKMARVIGSRLGDDDSSPMLQELSLRCCECLGWVGAVDPGRLLQHGGFSATSTDMINRFSMSEIDFGNKELAYQLLTEFFVDALNSAPDPTSHMKSGYCVQMLLQFLNLDDAQFEERFKSDKGDSAAVTLGPFRSTNYEVTMKDPIEKIGRNGRTFFGPEVPFAISLGEWIAHMSDVTTGANIQSKHIFGPLTVLKSTDGASRLFLFLLPYVVQNVICAGSESDRRDVLEEVKEILNEAMHAGSSIDELGESECRETSSTVRADHGRLALSVQAIFVLIDTLERWCRPIPPVVLKDPIIGKKFEEREFQDKMPVKQFLEEISRRDLAIAALRTGSSSRSLLYLESYLRARHSSAFLEHGPPTGGGIGGPGSRFGLDDPTIVRFDRDDIELLHEIYAAMEQDFDGIKGVVALRTRQGAAEQLQHERKSGKVYSQARIIEQIHEFESESRWTEALSCYEEALDSVLSSSSSAMSKQIGNSKSLSDLYEGKLRCLWRAGHLELLVDVCDGVLVRRPYLRPLVAPYAMDALWRLGKWNELRAVWDASTSTETLLGRKGAPGGVSGDYTESLAGAFLSAVEKSDPKQHIDCARLKIFELLSAACMESYERAYPLLVRLQVLTELETSLSATPAAKEDWLKNRSEMTSSNPLLRGELLAVRRAAYRIGAASAPSSQTTTEALRLDIESWLSLARTAREAGDSAACENALITLRGNLAVARDVTASAGLWRARIERAELLRSKGALAEAIQELQPDIELMRIDEAAPESLRRARAEALLLSTNLIVETGGVQGLVVQQRYEKCLKWIPNWAKAAYHMAKYSDFLMQRSFELREQQLADGKQDDLIKKSELELRRKDASVNKTLEAYGRALNWGTDHVFEVLPRIMTLWFSEAEKAHELASHSNKSSPVLSRGSTVESSSGKKKSIKRSTPASTSAATSAPLMPESCKTMKSLETLLPSHLWYLVMPQLVSRLCHPDPSVWAITRSILVRILRSVPARALWHVMGVVFSTNAERASKAKEVLKYYVTEGGSELERKLAKEYVETSHDLFASLQRFSKHLDISNRQKKVADSDVSKRYFMNKGHYGLVMPLQAYLRTATVSEHTDEVIPLFKSLGASYRVLESKEKPKRISLVDTDGKERDFLLKHERKGDLRKDSRMMEFSGVLNELFSRDVQSRKRRLKLRTFAVVCLSEDCGLIEWVNYTASLRSLIVTQYKAEGMPDSMHRTIRGVLEELQQKARPQDRVEQYRQKVLSIFAPIFHRHFLTYYGIDPSSWMTARLEFTRSAAAWSMVGHILGLGDRHAENILIDEKTGECVHVDFDCLFDKGLTLNVPEVVPFRLTPNMVDAFGVTGVEGAFRKTCEVSLGVLRENKAMLLSVLESFVVDPLVEWARRPVQEPTPAGRQVQVQRPSTPPGTRERQSGAERLKAIEERLDGIVRDRVALAAKWKQRKQSGDARRPTGRQPEAQVAAAEDENSDPDFFSSAFFDSLPVSVSGQVDRLIREAIDEENLCRMYSK